MKKLTDFKFLNPTNTQIFLFLLFIVVAFLFGFYFFINYMDSCFERYDDLDCQLIYPINIIGKFIIFIFFAPPYPFGLILGAFLLYIIYYLIYKAIYSLLRIVFNYFL
jgi:hypothetical protein